MSDTSLFTNSTDQYLSCVSKLYQSGSATEHSYRPALKALLESIICTTLASEHQSKDGLAVTNEPKRIACGAPDYIITRNDIPVGYIEAKDIPVGIHNSENTEQFYRYKHSLNNLIITDYINFELFVDGALTLSASIAKVDNKNINADKSQYDIFFELVKQFVGYEGKTITDSGTLAAMMAAKARLLSAIIERAIPASENEMLSTKNDELVDQLLSFREYLIHNLSPKEFADIFAQTISYGMFASRLNDKSNLKFTRMQAALNIPESNPFLKDFFRSIAGYELDDRICWVVDALADIFNCVAVEDLLKEFALSRQDPYIHFYETFLGEFDPDQRKSRGVWYTPDPIVQFIVDAADDILKTDFALQQGLADKSTIELTTAQIDGNSKESEFHKVQILDPATGTGTFLAAVIDKIHERFITNEGMWESYCTEHLIPRLHGFEILMASYAMAHFKLDMKLKETGYQNNKERLRVFLTNTLEDVPKEDRATLPFAHWLATESNEAAKIKRDTPVMVVMGNPPYNVSTQNKNKWIDDMIQDYKKDLNEKNIQPLSDDYIKFIRYGQYLVDKNQTGILAYISNNSFIDGLIHRQMRKTLLEHFDKIYILDLHGSAKKKENDIDGGKDENVFDIQQGASINIFIKNGKKTDGESAEIYHYDLYGKRAKKYQFLSETKFTKIKFSKLKPNYPYYFFVPKDFSGAREYNMGFSVTELFQINNNGIKTHNDAELVSFVPFKTKYNQLIQYRPFDYRYIDYDLEKVVRHRYSCMKHFLKSKNIGLIAKRGGIEDKSAPAFVSKMIIDTRSWSRPGMQGAESIFPLYIYPEKDTLDTNEKRRPNLNIKIVEQISVKIGLQYVEELGNEELGMESGGASRIAFAPIDILDYIYAVLHSPAYREKYSAFLKIDFPRVPYPENAEQFVKLSSFGATLRTYHLLDGIEPTYGMATYPIKGSNQIEKAEYKDGNVYINRNQHFQNVPQEAWEFFIGGYQPSQKWLKDRKGMTLTIDEIEHYQKIITALQKTYEIQAHIDGVLSLP